MLFRDHLRDLLAHLAGTLHCGPIELEDDRAMFGLDEDLGVIVDAEEGGDETLGAVIVSVVVGRPDPEDAELLRDLLCANYMWNASGGGSLGIDAASGALVVQRLVELPLDPREFEDIVAALAGAARYWRERMNPQPGGAAGPGAGALRA